MPRERSHGARQIPLSPLPLPSVDTLFFAVMTPPTARLDDLRIKRDDRPVPATSRRLWVILILLLVGAGLAVWYGTRPKPVEVRTTSVRAITGNPGERTVLNASGYVTARREATVSSKATGKVMEILIEEGDTVKAGDVLARIDDTNVQANLQLAHAQLDAAKAAIAETSVRLTEAEQDLARQQSLLTRSVAAQADFDHAAAAAGALRARLTQQQAGVTVAERTVAIWQQQLDDTIIRAPFAGIVTSKNAQPGEMISPMSSGGFTRTGICTIVDMDSREIEIDVNESYINRVTSGQEVVATLDAYPDWKIPCKVIAIIPTADRQKSTVRVRVGFDQLDPRILPQMAVKVGFRDAVAASAAPASRLVLVPKGAVQSVDGRDVVYVVSNGRAERRAVTVAGTQSGESTLSAGLAAGERVVVDAPAALTDGAAVKENPL
jgi:HlyD family secretion protein